MITILIVEDDPMVRMINEKFIEKIEDFKIIQSLSSVVEAKRYLSSNHVDLVLLDVFLPGENGTVLLKWMRENHIETDAIMITADKNIKTVEESFRSGVVDYLIKPFTFERLTDALLKYKHRYEAIFSIDTFNQEYIDKYMLSEAKIEHSAEDSDKKKNSSNTFDRIMDFFRDNKKNGYSATEIADKLGFSRITARRYLDILEKQNFLELEFEYGTIGRPKNIYKLKKHNE